MAVFSNCASAPPPAPPITPAERIQRDQAVGAGLARQLESQLKIKQDKEVLLYLHDLAAKLSEATPELKSAAVGVLVVADRGARWRCYSIPGNRIYLSSGLLRHIEFENELAAVIAMELAHVLKRHVPLRIEEGRVSSQASDPADYPSIEGLVPSSRGGAANSVDFFSPTGVFAFPDEYFLEAADGAVDILYRAGFDPRGLVSLWDIYRSEVAHSPFEDDLLRKLTEKTRTVIAQHSPLRNPIVRSQAFLTIQKRMQRL